MATSEGSIIEVFVSCANIPKMDILSKSDPFAVLFTRISLQHEWKEISRTEIIENHSHPEWTTPFCMTYHFESVSMAKISIYDADSKVADLNKHDFIGHIEFLLNDLVCSRTQSLTIPMECSKRHSPTPVVVIRGEETLSSQQTIELVLKAQNLHNNQWFRKPHSYLEISRLREDGSYIKVFSTNVVKSSHSPKWEKISISLTRLCNGDMFRPLRLQCWNHRQRKSSTFIGEANEITAKDLSKDGFSMDLINNDKKKIQKKYLRSGRVIVQSSHLVSHHTFLDYIRGGCQISVMVAIDFTGSNGDPNREDSLHYRHHHQMNQYETAIRGVCDIIAPYDTDQNFPVWGFGGIVNGHVRHCFPLTLNEIHDEVNGVSGILDAYANALSQVKLSGPTLFGEVIERAALICASKTSESLMQSYGILLILTDGVINDMAKSVEAIVAASTIPLSIIIVGIGSADFSAMNALDGDNERLHNRQGQAASRDIVQFVPMKDNTSPAALAESTLAEVPQQLLSYMSMNNIEPQALPQ